MKARTPIMVALIGAVAVVVAALIPAIHDYLFLKRPEFLSFRGVVRDGATNLPVKNAQVIALGYTDVAPDQTDNFGTFKLSIPTSRDNIATLRLQITHPEYQEYNRKVDLTKNEIESSILLQPNVRAPASVPPKSEKPAAVWPTAYKDVASADLQIADIDDIMSVAVNGNPVIHAGYGETPPWVSILAFLRRGPNRIEVIIQNGHYGGCGGTLTLRLNNTLNSDYRWTWSKQENQLPDVICFQQVKTLNLD